jgi:uncharacterized protein YutD
MNINNEVLVYRETFEVLSNHMNAENIEKLSEAQKDFANRVDYFALHYSHYLIGFAKSRRRTYFEYRKLIKCKGYDETYLPIILSEIEAFLLERELYEALAKFVKTNKILERL